MLIPNLHKALPVGVNLTDTIFISKIIFIHLELLRNMKKTILIILISILCSFQNKNDIKQKLIGTWKFERFERLEQEILNFTEEIVTTYGDPNIDFNPKLSSGLPIDVTVADSFLAHYSNGQLEINNAGNTEIDLYQSGDSFFKSFRATVDLLINKKDLSIIAVDTSASFGDTLPNPQYRIEGFVNGDTKDSLDIIPTPFYDTHSYSPALICKSPKLFLLKFISNIKEDEGNWNCFFPYFKIFKSKFCHFDLFC